MLTETEFKRLPDCFRTIIEIDRQTTGKVVAFDLVKRLAPQRREARRMCQISLQASKGGGVA